MAEYIRKYPDAPTAEEIETGYAPSTIKAGPFVKFAFWTFAGLAITYLIAYGAYLALDKVQEMEDERYGRMSARQREAFDGPQLQPSPGPIYSAQLRSKKLWQDDPSKLTNGRPVISDEALGKARAALQTWSK